MGYIRLEVQGEFPFVDYQGNIPSTNMLSWLSDCPLSLSRITENEGPLG